MLVRFGNLSVDDVGHILFLKAHKVKNPGSRGGKGYFDEHGQWQYGERPMGTKTVSQPRMEEPKWYALGSDERKAYYDPEAIRKGGNYEIWDFDDNKWWTFRDRDHEKSFRDQNPFAFLAENPAASERIWYRFGAPPSSNRSTNYADNKAESGVSVYVTTQGNNPFFADRKLWSGKGRQIGWGSDGEPLIIPTSDWKTTRK